MTKANVGMMALRSIMDGKAKVVFRNLSESLFVEEDERRLYQFIRRHVRKHNKVPSAVTAKAHGFDLPRVQEPPEYYSERLYNRAIFLAINSRQTELAKALGEGDMQAAVRCVREQYRAARAVRNANEFSTIQEVVKKAKSEYMDMKFQGGLPGITTGWPTMDEQTLGLCPGDLFTFAGRPGTRKTWRLLWMARAAWRAGYIPLVASGEMMDIAIVRRWLGIDTGINPKFIRTGRLQHWTEKKLFQAIELYDDMPPVYLVAGGFNKTIGGLEQLIEVLEPDIFFGDAFYLFRNDKTRKGASISDDLAENIHSIKGTLQDAAIPGAITVQFNRTVETNNQKDKRYSAANAVLDLNKIARSDAIGQDSDMVYGGKPCGPPYENSRSMNVPLKIREGDSDRTPFTIRTQDAPLDFSEVPPEELANEDSDDEEKAESNVKAMI